MSGKSNAKPEPLHVEDAGDYNFDSDSRDAALPYFFFFFLLHSIFPSLALLPSDSKTQRSVEDILAEIDQIDVSQIELHPDAEEFFESVQSYVECIDELESLYNQVDPSHELSNYDMPDINCKVRQRSLSGKAVKNLVELYEVAEVILPVFVAKIDDLLKQLDEDGDSLDTKLELAPGEKKLKGKERASEKAQDKYLNREAGPPESWLRDIVRGSIVFDSVEQLINFIELLCGDESIEIVKSKNRFRCPSLSGYRDWILQIEISTDNGVKHVCELQLHHKAIKETSEKLESLEYYEFFREYFKTGSIEERMQDLRQICDDGSLNTAYLWDIKGKPQEIDRLMRFADLFENHVHDYHLAVIITNIIRTSLTPAGLYTRMGRLFQKQIELEDAMLMYEKALNIRLKELGPGHADTVSTYNSMAVVLRSEGKLEEAMALYQKALGIRLKELGPDHANTAETYTNMAVILQNQGKLDEAISRYQEALEIRLKTLGPDHAITAETYNNLAVTFAQQGKLEEALAMSQKAFTIRLKALGPDHSFTTNTKALVEWMYNMTNEKWEEIEQA